MRAALCAASLLGAPAVIARETIGIYQGWAAFYDESPPRCFAIADPVAAAPSGARSPFVAIGFYPASRTYGQFHARLRFPQRPGANIHVTIGDRRFSLVARGQDAWAIDDVTDRAIVRAIRGARGLSIDAVAATGRGYADSYRLRGAPSAIDAAAIRCRD